MKASATIKYARVSPQKARLVADQIRGLSAERGIHLLKFSHKKSAAIIKKALDSAISNAEYNRGADIDELVISTIMVNEASIMKRFRSAARGRSTRIMKRSSHIVITVSDSNEGVE